MFVVKPGTPPIVSKYSEMNDGRLTKTDISLVPLGGKQYRYVLTHDVDARECCHATGHDHYALAWDATSDQSQLEACRAMGVMAANPNLRLDWHDVIVMQWLVKTVGYTIDPEKYAAFRQQG